MTPLLLAAIMAGAGLGVCQESGQLSLADALAEALNNNPRLAAAAARTERAEAGIAAASARGEPAITLTASGRLVNPTQNIEIPVGGVTRTVNITRPDQASAAINVSWPLWTGGRVAAAKGKARAEASAAEADLHQATEQVLYETAVAYYQALLAEAGLDEARAALGAAQEALRTTRVRRDAGAAVPAEVSWAAAAAEAATQQVGAAETSLTDARQGLNVLMARAVKAPVELVDAAFEFSAGGELDAEAVALATRPELLGLDYRTEAARQAIAQARAERRPTLGIAAQAGWQTPTDVMEDHQEFLGFEFSWPIFHHPGAKAGERAAKASVHEAEATRAELEDAIGYQVRESARRVADAQGRLSAAAEAVTATEAGLARADAASRAGTLTKQALATAQAARDSADAKHAQARQALSIAHVSRARALGLIRMLVLEASAP